MQNTNLKISLSKINYHIFKTRCRIQNQKINPNEEIPIFLRFDAKYEKTKNRGSDNLHRNIN